MQQVTTELLQEIVQRLVETLQPEQIILFGSHAYGEPHQDSDVDLLVIVAQSDQPRYRRSREAYGALSEFTAPTEILVMTRDEIERSRNVKASLVHQALYRGKVLYG